MASPPSSINKKLGMLLVDMEMLARRKQKVDALLTIIWNLSPNLFPRNQKILVSLGLAVIDIQEDNALSLTI